MAAGQGYTLGEIAEAAGMTARNVRAYQTRGLLPPPLRVGRRSVYDEAHLHRLTAIRRARHSGATLTLIANHLAEGGQLDAEAAVESWLQSWLPRPRAAQGSESMDPSPVPEPASPQTAQEQAAQGQPAQGQPARDQTAQDQPPASDPVDVTALLAAWAVDAGQQPVATLVELGVLVRDGPRLLAPRRVAGALATLQQRGLAVPPLLDLAAAVAVLAAPVAELAWTTLAGLPRPGEAAVELSELAGTVVRELVRQRVTPPR
jgi:DNA-binding transcriptional MerR regulator